MGAAEDTAAAPGPAQRGSSSECQSSSSGIGSRGLALVAAAVADLEVQVVAPAEPVQPTPPSSWPAWTRSPARDLGRLDHVHVDVGAVALAGRRGGRSCPGRRRSRSRSRPRRSTAISGVPGSREHVLAGVDVARARGAEGVLGGAVVDLADDRDERPRSGARCGARRCSRAVRSRPVGDLRHAEARSADGRLGGLAATPSAASAGAAQTAATATSASVG